MKHAKVRISSQFHEKRVKQKSGLGIIKYFSETRVSQRSQGLLYTNLAKIIVDIDLLLCRYA